MEWLLTETEELARLPHFVLSEEGERQEWSRTAELRGKVLPGIDMHGDGRTFLFLAPLGTFPDRHTSNSQWYQSTLNAGRYGTAVRDYGIEGEYMVMGIDHSYVTRVAS